MGGSAFVDTNILLRAMIPAMTLHQEAEALVQKLWADDVELWISRQIVREYLVQGTHPNTFTPPLTAEQVIKQVETITSLFHIADDTAEVTAHLLDLLQQFPTSSKQIHDANIVATMLAHGVDRLATLNIGDMKRFESKITLITLAEGTRS
jgi:predicted nucleic acid-binding protein